MTRCVAFGVLLFGSQLTSLAGLACPQRVRLTVNPCLLQIWVYDLSSRAETNRYNADWDKVCLTTLKSFCWPAAPGDTSLCFAGRCLVECQI